MGLLRSRLGAVAPPLAETNLWLAARCGPRITLRSIRLQRLSRSSFGWYTRKLQRWWEYPWVLEKFVDYGPRHGVVADFGAGTSPIPVALARMGYRAVVVDPDAETLLGRKVGNEWDMADYSPWNIPTLQAGIEDEVFADRELVGAVSVSALEHVPAQQRRQGFSQLAKSMPAGGVFVCTIDLMPDRRFLWNRVEDEIEPFDVHGTLQDVLQEADDAGFVLLDESWCPLRRQEPVVGIVLVRK